ncbi:hypothetical protein C2G38_1762115 [Gigaspora rosea]|uniref:Uncharacterized protein n=1 Tax=Gigaspora rosea TaxID=44941 RepID=A0A397USA1_9GLOM|nr:hypothetical protein C2G38_1762115 [Gigaspora rosea]
MIIILICLLSLVFLQVQSLFCLLLGFYSIRVLDQNRIIFQHLVTIIPFNVTLNLFIYRIIIFDVFSSNNLLKYSVNITSSIK